MAEEKKGLSKKGKDNKSKTSFIEKAKKSVRDLKGEMKKVVWPTKKQVINNTGIVIAVVASTGVVVGLVDFLLKLGADLILRMA